MNERIKSNLLRSQDVSKYAVFLSKPRNFAGP